MLNIQEVYEKYFTVVYRYLLSLSHNTHIAEELTQETFFKALKKVDDFRGECELSEDVFSADFVQDFADKKTAFRVHKVLHKLSEPYKEVFSLRVFGELSFSDISDLFGKSESWARVTYHRACKKIREELDDEDHL